MLLWAMYSLEEFAYCFRLSTETVIVAFGNDVVMEFSLRKMFLCDERGMEPIVNTLKKS